MRSRCPVLFLYKFHAWLMIDGCIEGGRFCASCILRIGSIRCSCNHTCSTFRIELITCNIACNVRTCTRKWSISRSTVEAGGTKLIKYYIYIYIYSAILVLTEALVIKPIFNKTDRKKLIYRTTYILNVVTKKMGNSSLFFEKTPSFWHYLLLP